MKTIFCDIDGTLVKYESGGFNEIFTKKSERLDGVLEFLDQAGKNHDYIVLTTARPESLRDWTVKQLTSLCIGFHALIMNIGAGPRFIVNDRSEKGEDKCFAINVDRNQGLEGIYEKHIQPHTIDRRLMY
jgi:phosphoglycolate phosphatase-like HAD superfamily hydrolase